MIFLAYFLAISFYRLIVLLYYTFITYIFISLADSLFGMPLNFDALSCTDKNCLINTYLFPYQPPLHYLTLY